MAPNKNHPEYKRRFGPKPAPGTQRDQRANDRQVGGGHYKTRAIEPWDYAIANNLDFMQGSVVRYVTRYKDKNGIEDLEKCKHYVEKMIETEKAKQMGVFIARTKGRKDVKRKAD